MCISTEYGEEKEGNKLKIFDDFLEKIDNKENRKKLYDLLKRIENDYPMLEKRIAWNQPMFTHNGTFIIGFSVAIKHFSMAPEWKAIKEFEEKIDDAGYEHGKMIIKFPWDGEVDYELIREIIEYNIEDKKDIKTFWRK